MAHLNLGILAHVDAGKTSLTERLLYAAGAIDRIGSVDDGNTQTDTMALERQRGITIKAAVAAFALGDVTVNLIDTPGHPDFIAEVERVLSVLDGAILVVSAVEGVQAQTWILMNALRRLRIPTLIFVNKIDRPGAQHMELLASMAERLTPALLPMGVPIEPGTRAACFSAFQSDDPVFHTCLAEVLSERDEALLSAYVEGRIDPARLRAALVAQSRSGEVCPVFFGSAVTGSGIAELLAHLTELLPQATGRPDAPLSGRVFKVERGVAGERIAYLRLFSGQIAARERIMVGQRSEQRVTALSVFRSGGALRSSAAEAGEIAKVWGFGDVRIGDAIGLPHGGAEQHFAPPTLQTVVSPRHEADRTALRNALAQLAEQDPLINLRQDDALQQISLSLYGEVQKEVIEATLLADYGLPVTFSETSMVCVERPIGNGEAIDMAPDPFLATIGLRLEPGPIDSGVDIAWETEYGALPVSFHHAIEVATRAALEQGLSGWQVTDCRVTITETTRLRKWAPSTAADHRDLAPLVVMDALRRAGTIVCEPVHRFALAIPGSALGPVLPVLARLLAVPEPPQARGSGLLLTGDIPATAIHTLQQALPALARGEGVLECHFGHFRPVRGEAPTRPRKHPDPLNRPDYLLHLRGGR